MSFQAFLNETAKGLPSLVYLFHASDTFLSREAIKVIKRLVPEGERDFNLHVFDFSREADEKTPFEQVFDAANTVPFFGKRRFVIWSGNLKGLTKKDLKRLESYISDPAPHSVLLLFHEGVLKKEMRQRVSVDDVSEIVEGGGFYTPFDLVDALEAKNPEKVFRIYKVLKETTESYRLIGILNWLYGRNLPVRSRTEGNKYLLKVFEILNKADIDIKSSGRDFPLEYLLVKLLRISS